MIVLIFTRPNTLGWSSVFHVRILYFLRCTTSTFVCSKLNLSGVRMALIQNGAGHVVHQEYPSILRP